MLWLGFAAAAALVAIAVFGLTAHELTTERVVHSLEVDRKSVGGREVGRDAVVGREVGLDPAAGHEPVAA